MANRVQPGYRVIRGPDWSYRNQDGGRGHAGTVLGQQDFRLPNLPKHSVLVQWDNGNKGLYRVGNDQAFDLRITDTSNAVCHPNIWCDGCNANEIKGMRWRCTECYAIDLCTTCYMNGRHDTSHVFMRVLNSDDTSMGPKMLPRSSSPRIALRGSFPGATVVRYPQWCKCRDKQLGKVVNHGPTLEDKTKVRAMVDFSLTLDKPERVDFTEITCTLPGSGGRVYEGHLPNLGDPEPVSEGDKVLVTATPAELEKLHKRRGLLDPHMAPEGSLIEYTCKFATSLATEEQERCNTFRRKGLVKRRTHSGDFKVTFNDSKETFTMNPAALRKIYPLSLGQLVRISDDIEMVKRLQFGHGGWKAAMKKEIGRVVKVVKIDGSDIHVRTRDNHKFIFNSANLTPTIYHAYKPEEKSMVAAYRKFNRVTLKPEINISNAVHSGDIRAIERVLNKHPEMMHYDPEPGTSLLSYVAAHGKTAMVKFLVEKKGAFLESHNVDGSTPLVFATCGSNVETVRYLLEQGADVNAVNPQGYTSAYMACNKGFSECARLLIMHGSDINYKDHRSVTPVFQSIAKGRTAILDVSWENKEADLKTVPISLCSLLHAAASVGNTHGMMKLLDRVPRLVEAKDIDGCTPLFSACNKGYLEATELLIKKGHCNVNVQSDEGGITALGEAINQEHFHLVDTLVKNGADSNIRNRYGNTPLHTAFNAITGIPPDEIKEEPYMAEMKKKWGHLGIKTNGHALVAFLVSHGGDLDAPNCEDVPFREFLPLVQDTALLSLLEIQAQTGRDIAKQQSTVSRPLRSVTKKTNGTGSDVSPVSSLINTCTAGSGTKKKGAKNSPDRFSLSSGSRQKPSCKKTKNVRQRAAGDSRAQASKEKASDTGALHHLQAELHRKDEELDGLWSRVKTLEHLVKKKIYFTCGHDVIRSMADLFPMCPQCREPITSVTDI